MQRTKPVVILSKDYFKDEVHPEDEPSTDQPVNTSKSVSDDDFNIEDMIGDFTD